MDVKKVAGWAGIVVVVLAILNLVLLGTPPDSADPAAKVAEYIAKDTGMHKWGLFFGFLISIPVVVFLSGFLPQLFKSDREHGEGFGIVAFAGFLLVGASAGTADIASAALHLRGGEQLGPDAVRALFDLQTAGYSSAGIGVSVLGLGVAMAIHKRKLMAGWLGWLATAMAVLGLFGLFGMLSSSSSSSLAYLSFLSFLVWLLATSIVMIREGSAPVGGKS